jgi:hypothetical protein
MKKIKNDISSKFYNHIFFIHLHSFHGVNKRQLVYYNYIKHVLIKNCNLSLPN